MRGIAIGKVFVLREDLDYNIQRFTIPAKQTAAEIKKIRKVIEEAGRELDDEAAHLKEYSEIGAKILDFHKVLLQSPDLEQEIVENIKNRMFSLEYSIHCVIQKWNEHFSKKGSQKQYDLLDIEDRLMRYLGITRHAEIRQLANNKNVVAHTLTPSQTSSLFHSKVKGFATDVGGTTSHTAIVARALSIPAVVGTGDLSSRLKGEETIIIDGIQGLVIVSPDEATLTEYREKEKRHRKAFGTLMAERDFPAETLDGYKTHLSANIELTEETELAQKMGAEGIGLYRTEFLYEENRNPSEEMQTRAYEEVLTKMEGKQCVIRTMDLGADKFIPASNRPLEPNPFLGERSIRYSLQNPSLFMTQLRAILRASVKGKASLMFPMISSIEEVRQAKQFFEQAKESLAKEQIPFADSIPVGIMVEVPSAALTVDLLAKEIHFLSIGTNDLVQYTLAVDRVNEQVAHLYQPGSPAILRLLKHIISVGLEHTIDVSVCGEMCADPRFALLLLGMGLRHFSVAPTSIPTVKHIIRSVTLREAEAIAEKALTFATAEECNRFLQDRVDSLLPHV